jgi:hypothetical protein
MKTPVLSTYRVLKNKALNEDIDKSWIDWAVEMMKAGYESDNLYILAGITKPYNQFELQELTDNVLQDIGLDYSDKEITIRNYAYFLIKNSIQNPSTYLDTLREFKEIFYALNMHVEYQDFFSLYWAKEDLLESEHQSYWENATRENIDEIIKTEFQKFIGKFEQQKP